jgi:hypothetical protein
MSQPELLAKVTATLSDAGIRYMITGSVASSLQGEPRSSHDIDLVVALNEEHAAVMLRAFPPPEYYLSERAMMSAIATRKMFNLLDVIGGDTVDFWMLTDEPFDRARFGRRQWNEFRHHPVCVSSPEDTILAKLRWANLCGGSEKQFTDARQVYEFQHTILDLAYMNEWVERLNLQELWARLRNEARPSDIPN